MTEQQLKFANELHYAVKGHLINPNYNDEEVMAIYDSYLKRLWGNHERLVYCREHFEKAWSERNGIKEDARVK
jgi:hypothetical protein